MIFKNPLLVKNSSAIQESFAFLAPCSHLEWKSAFLWHLLMHHAGNKIS